MPVPAQSAADLARAALEKQKGRSFWLQPNGVLLRHIGLVYETSATRTELPKIAGQLCLDRQEVELVHLELEFIKDHRIGFGVVGSIRRGTTYSMELAKQVDNQWPEASRD